jgi:hypothetical protein
MSSLSRRVAAAQARRRAIAERGWKNFCAALGYPDPDTITQERAIWQASDTQIRTSRICSASSVGKVAVTSPEIREIVDSVYDHYLPLPTEWTPQQREEFLEAQAARISRQVAELSAAMGEQAISAWKRQNGQPPDYMTQTGLLNTARSQAMEIVLTNELYEQIPPENDPQDNHEPLPPTAPRTPVPWEQRWTNTEYRRDPTEQIEDLAAAVWPAPDFSAVFRIKAGYLLATRDEDQLPLPTHRNDPLAATLAQLIYADLRHDGLPER